MDGSELHWIANNTSNWSVMIVKRLYNVQRIINGNVFEFDHKNPHIFLPTSICVCMQVSHRSIFFVVEKNQIKYTFIYEKLLCFFHLGTVSSIINFNKYCSLKLSHLYSKFVVLLISGLQKITDNFFFYFWKKNLISCVVPRWTEHIVVHDNFSWICLHTI